MTTPNYTTELKPCPFCGAGDTTIRANHLNIGVTMNNTPESVISAEVIHWCKPVEGQPHRRMITMAGRDEGSAIKAWNTRTAAPALAAEVVRLQKRVEELVEALRFYAAGETYGFRHETDVARKALAAKQPEGE